MLLLLRFTSPFKLTHSITRASAKLATVVTRLNERPASDGLSLDVNLLADHPDVVISHLHARKADESIVGKVAEVKQLKDVRNKLITEGDSARNKRKELSRDIAMLMKENKQQEVEKLKEKVSEVNAIASKADEELIIIDNQLKSILSFIPNLLADR